MHPEDGRVVSNFIMQALKNKEITIYGDGNQTRSFCYIDDTIRGISKLMQSNYQNPINIGGTNEITINELINKIKTIYPSCNKIKFHDLPENDPLKRKPDISLAIDVLHWKPKISLDEGLKKTLKFFLEEF